MEVLKKIYKFDSGFTALALLTVKREYKWPLNVSDAHSEVEPKEIL